MTEALDWAHAVTQVRDKQAFQRRASEQECAQLTQLLGEPRCLSLHVRYEINPKGPGRYHVSGRLEAAIEQACGVTLDPVVQAIDEMFAIEFRADVRRTSDLEPDFDAFSDDDPEPIEQGEIRIGRYLTELLASAIDPFPRAPDAELDQTESGRPDATNNPFAALQRLKEQR